MSTDNDLEQQVLQLITAGDIHNLEAALKRGGKTISNYRQSDGATLLHLAVVCGPERLITELLQRGVDPNAQTITDEATALHMAVASDRLAAVEALLSNSPLSSYENDKGEETIAIDDTIRDAAGRTALNLATSKPIETAIRYAQTKYVDKILEALRKAIMEGASPVKIKALISSARAQALVDVNSRDDSKAGNGETILHAAVRTGRAEIVQACLDIGANAYAKDRKGRLAIELTQNEQIRALLRSAPPTSLGDPNQTDANISFSGHLLKWANMATGYRRRFVVIEDGILTYYKRKADYPVNCRGSIHLQYAALLLNRDHLGFALRAGGQTLYFKAENSVDAARWRMILSRFQRRDQQSQSAGNVDALMAARALHGKSRAVSGPTHISHTEYERLLHSARDCLAKLARLSSPSSTTPLLNNLGNQSKAIGHSGQSDQPPEKETEVSQSEGSIPDPEVRERLLRSLQDFFVVASQREQYWQTRLEAEVRKRNMMEDARHQIGISSVSEVGDEREEETISIPSASGVCREYNDEFYDALEEAEALAVLSLTDEEEAESSLSIPISIEPPSKESSPQPLTEPLVPAEELAFIADDLLGYPEERRTTIPVDSTKIPPISIWNIIKNAIGKDLTRIPIPVNFSEPISMLQRLAEDLEYAELLYLASMATDPLMRLQYVAAFAISPYASTDGRISKPFNPLLGETFEYVSQDSAFRYISEQVSHHPPISACHCESARFIYWAEVAVRTRFWGKSLELVPEGLNHVLLKDTGEHFSYRKVTTAVYNLILGRMWIDHFGTLTVVNHQTGDRVEVEFKPTGWRTTDAKRLQGVVYDATGTAVYNLEGYWHRYLRTKHIATGRVADLWHRRPLPSKAASQYHFTSFTVTLNELSSRLADCLCPTDSRLRPDQRAMEEGYFEHANLVKVLLEEKQRAVRRQWEQLGDGAFQYRPRWFERATDPDSGEEYWRYLGGYWESRRTGNWDGMMEIYLRSEELPTNPSPSLTSITSSSRSNDQTITTTSSNGSHKKGRKRDDNSETKSDGIQSSSASTTTTTSSSSRSESYNSGSSATSSRKNSPAPQ